MRFTFVTVASLSTIALGLFCTINISAPSAVGQGVSAASPIGCRNRRTAIRSLPYQITECGSYFVADCLTGVAGMNGITISTSDVTLDLNGFTLAGVTDSLDGIHILGGDQLNIAIYGGSVVGWGGDGIDAAGGVSASNEIQITEVRLMSNVGHGIYGGSEVSVRRCFANKNNFGVIVGGGAVVDGCIIRDNANGIRCGNDSLITNNFVDDHCGGGIGIHVPANPGLSTSVDGNMVTDCSVGIQADGSGVLITRNRVQSGACAGVNYANAGGNSLIVTNTPVGAGAWDNFTF